ncbi:MULTISPECIES: hypothetical protein [unclassified Sphingopyxis]|uniref:hypothetical protein n=1 Tax=unclassified Sphingopyxis TaxID=2614943 RepID=UPI000736D70C|nr:MULTISPECIES: hypothetical protein [unclassified Sphingopyxis]KTE38036.1 hypothetical protein ATE62_11840 [Sphingopyxis sp. HIX]KTE84656.1 hypothetical protein ATE72_07910 [Sphingopyxis sp. HXXIV]
MTKPTRLLLPLLAALAFAVPAAAQVEDLAQSSQPPEKFSFLIAYGNDECPEAEGDEIVVCAQEPEADRYRVPKELRDELREEDVGGGGSWASTVEAHDDVARLGRPNSCSAVGSYGFTGCTSAMLRQWFAERRSTR